MSRSNLKSKFDKASKILRQDDNTNSLLDYVEQISWLLFLKCFEELEDLKAAEFEFEGRPYSRILHGKYRWSKWTDPTPGEKLTGKALLSFLNDELFPFLRSLPREGEAALIRAMFEEAPSKMLKDGAILRDAIDELQAIDFHAVEDTYTLSYLYESMLSKLGREGGMGGEFYTPRPIIEFIVNVVDPKVGQTVYDPAMGSCGFLVEAYKHMRQALGDKITTRDEKALQTATFTGQEKKPLPYLLGCMNMILHGVLTPALTRKNTLGDNVRSFTEKDRFDVILTNPPFGGTEHESVGANFRYPSRATSITFLQHIMAKTKRGGRVGMVIDEGVLFKTGENSYVQTKKELLEGFNLYAIVSLPAGVFANAVSAGAGPKTSLMFFDRTLDGRGMPIGTSEIWYYEVETVGFTLTKTQKPIPETDLPECLELLRQKGVSLKSWVVSREEIESKNYDLSAVNPNALKGRVHRTPEDLASSIANQQNQILTLAEEIRAMFSATASVDIAERHPLLQNGTTGGNR